MKDQPFWMDETEEALFWASQNYEDICEDRLEQLSQRSD